MTSANNQGHKPERINRRFLILYLLGTPLVFVLFLFLPAGTWVWPKGWLFLGVLLVPGALGSWYIWRVNPELYAARINPHRGIKLWDKILIGFVLSAMLAIACLHRPPAAGRHSSTPKRSAHGRPVPSR